MIFLYCYFIFKVNILIPEHFISCSAGDYFALNAVAYCKLQNKPRRLFRALMTQGFDVVLCWDYPPMLKRITANKSSEPRDFY